MNINKLLAKVFGSANEREVMRLRPLVEQVNALEPQVEKLTDEQLRGTACEFRERLSQILEDDPARVTRDRAKKNGELDAALGEILPEVFARVREASRRVVGMRHFDVQLIGGMVLHSGKIAEMLAPVSGFVLRAEGEPTVYVAGDTIWCDAVRAALDEHSPDVVVVNASGARFNEGDPIVMTVEDVATVARHVLPAKVVAVHLEAINHCLEPRSAYADLPVSVPADGADVITKT